MAAPPCGPVVRIDRAFRRTLAWQAGASLVLALVSAYVAGAHGFYSAALGGGIGVAGVLVFALVSMRSSGDSRGAVRIALRAEGAKVLVIVGLLWLAFTAYHNMVVGAFLGAFVVSVLLSGLAFAVSADQLSSNSSKV